MHAQATILLGLVLTQMTSWLWSIATFPVPQAASTLLPSLRRAFQTQQRVHRPRAPQPTLTTTRRSFLIKTLAQTKLRRRHPSFRAVITTTRRFLLRQWRGALASCYRCKTTSLAR